MNELKYQQTKHHPWLIMTMIAAMTTPTIVQSWALGLIHALTNLLTQNIVYHCYYNVIWEAKIYNILHGPTMQQWLVIYLYRYWGIYRCINSDMIPLTVSSETSVSIDSEIVVAPPLLASAELVQVMPEREQMHERYSHNNATLKGSWSPTGYWKRNIDRITEWTFTIIVLSCNLKTIRLIIGNLWLSYHAWVKTTDFLITLHTPTKSWASGPSYYASWQVGILYDVVSISNISTILKVTGKRVPRNVDPA